MKIQNILWILVSLSAHGTVWAYGDSTTGTNKACTKPEFYEFKPENNAQVAAKSSFSFTASAATFPKSLKVTIKGQPVPITVTKKNAGFLVTGKLPDALQEGYARISIAAEGSHKCSGNGGWLVKVVK